MSDPVRGDVRAVEVLENNVSAILVKVNTHTPVGSWTYRCDPQNVTLDGRAIDMTYHSVEVWIGLIARWVCTHRTVAVVTDPDWQSQINDVVACERIALTDAD